MISASFLISAYGRRHRQPVGPNQAAPQPGIPIPTFAHAFLAVIAAGASGFHPAPGLFVNRWPPEESVGSGKFAKPCRRIHRAFLAIRYRSASVIGAGSLAPPGCSFAHATAAD